MNIRRSRTATTSAGYIWSPQVNVLNFASLGLLVWGITSQTKLGSTGRPLAASALLVVASITWAVWVLARSGHNRALSVTLPVMVVAGGGLVGFASLGAIFMAVACFAASAQWGIQRALPIGALGCVSMAVGLVALNQGTGVALAGIAATVAGIAGGVGRLQSQRYVAQTALLHHEKERGEVERQRAELLAERNHLAREIHDVLAHTLSALSVQLEALDSVVQSEGGSERVRQQVDRSKQLVREGLGEARRAVQALRSIEQPLPQQITTLAEADGVPVTVSGEPRPLAPDTAHALYRAAQEALSNALKHGSLQGAHIVLEYLPATVRLEVTNPGANGNGSSATVDGLDVPAGPSSAQGGGYGLVGMRERAAALGGKAHAGPAAGLWRVEVELPT